eukprot:6188193-Pleurochrysis_carterae.AAC.1
MALPVAHGAAAPLSSCRRRWPGASQAWRPGRQSRAARASGSEPVRTAQSPARSKAPRHDKDFISNGRGPLTLNH